MASYSSVASASAADGFTLVQRYHSNSQVAATFPQQQPQHAATAESNNRVNSSDEPRKKVRGKKKPKTVDPEVAAAAAQLLFEAERRKANRPQQRLQQFASIIDFTALKQYEKQQQLQHQPLVRLLSPIISSSSSVTTAVAYSTDTYSREAVPSPTLLQQQQQQQQPAISSFSSISTLAIASKPATANAATTKSSGSSSSNRIVIGNTGITASVLANGLQHSHHSAQHISNSSNRNILDARTAFQKSSKQHQQLQQTSSNNSSRSDNATKTLSNTSTKTATAAAGDAIVADAAVAARRSKPTKLRVALDHEALCNWIKIAVIAPIINNACNSSNSSSNSPADAAAVADREAAAARKQQQKMKIQAKRTRARAAAAGEQVGVSNNNIATMNAAVADTGNAVLLLVEATSDQITIGEPSVLSVENAAAAAAAAAVDTSDADATASASADDDEDDEPEMPPERLYAPALPSIITAEAVSAAIQTNACAAAAAVSATSKYQLSAAQHYTRWHGLLLHLHGEQPHIGLVPRHNHSVSSATTVAAAASAIAQQLHQPSLLYAAHCRQMFDSALDASVQLLLEKLVYFQLRMQLKLSGGIYNSSGSSSNTIISAAKASMLLSTRKRYVCGLKEVRKHVLSGRVHCVVVATNIQHSSDSGIDSSSSNSSLSHLLLEVLMACTSKQCVVVFACHRKQLSRVMRLGHSHNTSCVGLMDYGGAQELYNSVWQQTRAAQERYAMWLHDPLVHRLLQPSLNAVF